MHATCHLFSGPGRVGQIGPEADLRTAGDEVPPIGLGIGQHDLDVLMRRRGLFDGP